MVCGLHLCVVVSMSPCALSTCCWQTLPHSQPTRTNAVAFVAEKHTLSFCPWLQLFAFCVDGIAIVIGSLLGCAPLTVYIESASGELLARIP
jgi:xanthine/uracil/vitamin C permease (AzgA family)